MANEESVTLPKDLLIRYYSDYFVETGSFFGGAIQTAIDAGFSEIRSIEVDPELYLYCQNRFMYDTRVTLYLGDTLEELPRVIADISDRITFWLDAHYGNSPTQGEDPTPLLRELSIIKEHPRHDHILLIDDVRLFGKNGWDRVTKFSVLETILEINPRYEIAYMDSKLFPQDILVAYIPEDTDD